MIMILYALFRKLVCFKICYLIDEWYLFDLTFWKVILFAVCAQLEDDVIGIIGVCEKCALATIQSYSDTFQVPFLLISSAPIPDDVTSDSYQFFLTPVFIQGLLDIVINKEWQRVFYIYDTDEGSFIIICFAQMLLNPSTIKYHLMSINFVVKTSSFTLPNYLSNGHILYFNRFIEAAAYPQHP